MPDSDVAPEPIEVRIALDSADAEDGVYDELRQSIEAYALALVSDSGLPALPYISISTDRDAGKGGLPFRMTIGGRSCRVAMPARGVLGDESGRLERMIENSIFENRLLFLTPEVKRLIPSNTVNQNKALNRQPYELIERFVQSLVKRCFGVDRCRTAPTDPDTSGWNHSMFFESLIGDVRSPPHLG